jgi:hypothetical protein
VAFGIKRDKKRPTTKTKTAGRPRTSNDSSAKFAQGEHVRIVPLHYPKPSVSIDELGRLRGETADTDPFDGQPHVAPASAHLTYNNGPLLTAVQVFTVFWGTKWSGPGGSVMMQNLNKFFQALVVSPLVNQLQEYGVHGQNIGSGSFIGTKVVTANAPVGSVADSAIRKQLKAWIAAKTVSKNTKNTLYFVYLDPGIVSVMGGSKSCQNYCGYHDAIGSIYYAVMPYPTCAGCLGGLAAFDALTGTSSHEFCEAITDPVPGKGWYDNVNGEIGDICAWNFKKVAGYNVQMEWSNAQNRCV